LSAQGQGHPRLIEPAARRAKRGRGVVERTRVTERLAMNLLERLPWLDDAELKNLAENARRLIEAGSEKQREAAKEILPAVETVIAARRTQRWAAAAATAAKRAAEKRALRARAAERDAAESHRASAQA
jgi:hypothetical protein